MDVEITEYDDETNGGTITSVYDLEPHRKDDLHMPRHNRYYQAKVDGRYVRRGLKDFSAIPNLYVITITDYDLFGEDYMVYTVHNKCEEVPAMEYDDGLKFVYFYTKGKKGGSQAIKNMLTYIQNSDSKNAVDDATRLMDSYVTKVKSLPEVEAGYMTLGDWIDGIAEDIRAEVREEVKDEVREEVKDEVREEVKDEVREEVKDEVREEVKDEVREEVKDEVREEMKEEEIRFAVELLQEYCKVKEDAVLKLQVKFPKYADRAEEFLYKYWKEEQGTDLITEISG